MFRRLKIDYVIAILFLVTTVLGIFGTLTIVYRIDKSYRLHLAQLEEHSRVLYLSQHLRNLSHNINVHSTIYSITNSISEKTSLDSNHKAFNDTLKQLKASPLFTSASSLEFLASMERLQTEKIKFLMNSVTGNLREKARVLLSPELREKNIVLRTSLESLITKERDALMFERVSISESHDEVLQGSILISLLLFILALILALFVLRNARNLRMAHQQTLEAINSRDDILAVVSHDLKNPLSSISLNAQIMKKRLSGPQKEDGPILKKVESILRSVEVMKNLIQDLLDQARLESGKIELKIKKENFSEVLNEVEEVMVPMLQNKSVHIENHLPETPAIIKADKKRLMQILSNLLSNAVKFSEDGGKVEIFAAKAGPELKVSVQNHGTGISSRDLPHVFERFWQARETATKGTGLGLSIVKNLVTAHGGKIWVESKPGSVTTFFFTLPMA